MSERKRAPRRLPSRRGGDSRRGSKPAERSEALARRKTQRAAAAAPPLGGGGRRGPKPAARQRGLGAKDTWRGGKHSWLSRWVVLACGVALWQLWAGHRHSAFFPPPSTIWSAMHQKWFNGPAGHLFLNSNATGNILPSLGRIGLGLAIVVAIGVPLGIAIGRSRVLMDYLDPLLQFFRSIPVVTAAPVFIALFKIGTQMEVATIVAGTIWPLLLNTIDGARSVDPVQVETARAFRYTAWVRLRWLIFPSTLPSIFTGLRLALSLSLILMVFSELVGSSNGIGYEMDQANSAFNLPDLWSALVLLGILGYLMNAILYLAERYVLAWHRASHG